MFRLWSGYALPSPEHTPSPLILIDAEALKLIDAQQIGIFRAIELAHCADDGARDQRVTAAQPDAPDRGGGVPRRRFDTSVEADVIAKAVVVGDAGEKAVEDVAGRIQLRPRVLVFERIAVEVVGRIDADSPGYWLANHVPPTSALASTMVKGRPARLTDRPIKSPDIPAPTMTMTMTMGKPSRAAAEASMATRSSRAAGPSRLSSSVRNGT